MCVGGGLHILPVPNKPRVVAVDVKPSIPVRPQTSELVITAKKEKPYHAAGTSHVVVSAITDA